jgi:hypothetical protein
VSYKYSYVKPLFQPARPSSAALPWATIRCRTDGLLIETAAADALIYQPPIEPAVVSRLLRSCCQRSDFDQAMLGSTAFSNSARSLVSVLSFRVRRHHPGSGYEGKLDGFSLRPGSNIPMYGQQTAWRGCPYAEQPSRYHPWLPLIHTAPAALPGTPRFFLAGPLTTILTTIRPWVAWRAA